MLIHLNRVLNVSYNIIYTIIHYNITTIYTIIHHLQYLYLYQFQLLTHLNMLVKLLIERYRGFVNLAVVTNSSTFWNHQTGL